VELSLSKEDAAFRDEVRTFLAGNPSGIALMPQTMPHSGVSGLKADFGDFAKWIRENHPSVRVTVPVDAPRILLRGADIWLPLVYLATDASAQVFLNMVANYLYDRSKGLLKNDQPRIHFTVEYEDRTAGITKRLEFSGDAESLGKITKRFDPNNFLALRGFVWVILGHFRVSGAYR